MNASPIAVLGAGAWGTALAVLLARNGQAVRLWDHDANRLTLMQNDRAWLGVTFPDSLQIETQLEKAVHAVSDVCLVETDDVIVVMQRGQAEAMSDVVAHLEKGPMENLL